MAERCSKHKLTLAPDGRCVLCRRSAGVFGLDQASESWLSRTLTIVLGGALLAALVSLVTVQSPPSQAPTITAERAPTTAPTPEPPAATTSGTPAVAVAEERVVQARWKEIGVDRETFETARGEVELVMYAASWCYICDSARSFLQGRGVTLVEHDIDMEPEAMRRLTRLNPGASLPTFQLQGETIVGFNAWNLADRVDDLAAERIVAGR